MANLSVLGARPVIRFAADAKPLAPSLENLKHIPDPKPRMRTNWRNVFLTAGGLLAGTLGLYNFGSISGPSARDEFHTWARTEAANKQTGNSTEARFWHAVAQTDATLETTPVVNYIPDNLLLFTALDLVVVGLAARKALRKKSIRPEELHGVMNKLGLTGKGVKYAIIDDGVIPSNRQVAKRLTIYSPEDWNKPIKPRSAVGHGSCINDLLARANPDAECIGYEFLSPAQRKESNKAIFAFIKAARKNPELLTHEKLRELDKTDIDNVCKALRHAVDQGAQAVNMSLGFETSASGLLSREMSRQMRKFAMMNFGLSKVGKWVLPKSTQAKLKANLEQKQAYIMKLGALMISAAAKTTDQAQMREMYKPWVEALDYAAQHNTAVFLSAGNDGGHQSAGNLLGHVDPLAMVNHPALFVIGSTDSEGEISSFTSEYNDQVQPTMGGLGSGEIRLHGPVTVPKFVWLLSPGSAFKLQLNNEYPAGTSFASPFDMSVYLKMRQVDPTLKLDEAKAIFNRVVQPARFSPDHQEVMTQEWKEQKLQRYVDALIPKALTVLDPLFSIAAEEKPKEEAASEPAKPAAGETTQPKEPETIPLPDIVFDQGTLKLGLKGFKVEGMISHPQSGETKLGLNLKNLGRLRKQSPDQFAAVFKALILNAIQENPDFTDKLIANLDYGDKIPKLEDYLAVENRRRIGPGTLVGQMHKAVHETARSLKQKQTAPAKPVETPVAETAVPPASVAEQK